MRCNRKLIASMLGAVLLLASTLQSAASAGDRLIVHEWGTFTTLQDEHGRELPGINIDDEPAPDFVHNLQPFLLNSPVLTDLHWQYRQKGAPRRHPKVTMRLETPVIYFYPPQGQEDPLTLDVSVRFRGGWLTEFFPYAEANIPGVEQGAFDFGDLTRESISGLTWRDLKVGVNGSGPTTSEPVWLAPRNVAAASVATPDGEHEKFLFYRGVANQRSPLRVTTNRDNGELRVLGNFDEVLHGDKKLPLPALWLLSIRADGSVAFRTVDARKVNGNPDRVLATVSSRFEDGEYSSENLEKVKSQMHEALVAEGLYADEATALLSTWQRAYFVSPGLRMFYLVPRQWTDHYLPLSLSREADIQRVMIGRIELINEEQRNLLARLAQTANSDGRWVDNIADTPARDRFLAGRSGFGDLGVQIPPDYQMYLALGRFRNALVVAEEHARPTENLSQFIDTYGLHPYRWEALARANPGRHRDPHRD